MYFNFPKNEKKKKSFLKRVIYSQELYKVSFQSLHLTQFILKYIITSHPQEVDKRYLLVCLDFHFYIKKNNNKIRFTNQRMVLVSRQSTLFDKKEKKKQIKLKIFTIKLYFHTKLKKKKKVCFYDLFTK